MEAYLWVVYALGSAFFIALMLLVSEHYKQSGIGFLTVTRFFTALTLLPFVFFVEWPIAPLFYVYTGIAYFLFPISDIFVFRVSSQQGAGVLTRFLPLTAILSFFMWLIIDVDTWHGYLNEPLLALGGLACLCGVVFCASFLRSCEVSKAAFKIFLPILFIMPVGGVLQKLAFDQTALSSASLINLFVGSFVAVVVYAVPSVLIPKVRKEFVVNSLTVKAAILASVCSTILIYMANMSFDLVSNPAYATAVSFTSAIWVLLIYKLMGKQDSARILPGIGIVIFTALLVVLSGL